MAKKKKSKESKKSKSKEKSESDKDKSEEDPKRKLLREAVSDIGGKPAERLFEIIYGKENVNEFLIAKKLDATINDVRNILYRLSDYNLVDFTREKDDKKGWYTYFWTLDEAKALKLLNKKVEERIGKIESRIEERQQRTHYICEDCSREVREDRALEENFTCPECGEIYDVHDDSKIVKKMGRRKKKLKDKRKKIFEELKKIREVEAKERKKEAEKARKRKARREREKKKKNGKIPVEEIKGIGKKKAKKFKNNRITSAAALARLKPGTIAEKTGVSEKTAKKYKKRAEKLKA